MTTETLSKAGEIWEYMAAFKSRSKSDAIVICCSYDLRVCDHACDLIMDGISDTLVISGKFGNWTQHIWDKPEAEMFCERAIKNGICEKQIIMEVEASNFGENISFSRARIPGAKVVTFVSKPNSLLRVKLTAEAQWPEIETIVSCPDIKFPDEVSSIIGVWGAINEMVGDIERIQKYPARGFQAAHRLPEEIMLHWVYLIEQGFTFHLMPDRQMSLGPAEAASLI
ncbi:MAG: YdcF family protein [Gammaproteobacteria bacterium]|nr:YdcF family protein [Gammaproteobacteria bacterium]